MKSRGMTYWASWLHDFKEWLKNAPAGILSEQWLEVNEVSYEDLAAIAHHQNVIHHSEDSRHRQWVQLEFENDVSLTFYSPARGFSYHAIKA